jgi:hypothetical protein
MNHQGGSVDVKDPSFVVYLAGNNDRGRFFDGRMIPIYMRHLTNDARPIQHMLNLNVQTPEMAGSVGVRCAHPNLRDCAIPNLRN